MTAPIDHPLNLGMQALLTYASWGLTFVLLIIAVRMGMRERTPFYVLVLLASIVAAFAEPIYDVGLMLWFYTPGIWSHFSAFGIPQPNWTHSGYAILYGSTAMFACQQIHQGKLGRKGFYIWAAVEFLLSCTFEIIAINGGAYEYWGPHVWRIFNYPLVIPILESAQVMCFTIAAAELRRQTADPISLLALFVIFPGTFYFANFGAGSPVILAMHLDPEPIASLIYAGTLLSIVFALTIIRVASGFLPVQVGAVSQSPSSDRTVPART